MAANEWMIQWEGDGNKHRLCSILAEVGLRDEEATVWEVFTRELQPSRRMTS